MVASNSLMQTAIPERGKGQVFTLMGFGWSVMEIASIGIADLLGGMLGIQPVCYLGGSLPVLAGFAGLVLLNRYRFNSAANSR